MLPGTSWCWEVGLLSDWVKYDHFSYNMAGVCLLSVWVKSNWFQFSPGEVIKILQGSSTIGHLWKTGICFWQNQNTVLFFPFCGICYALNAYPNHYSENNILVSISHVDFRLWVHFVGDILSDQSSLVLSFCFVLICSPLGPVTRGWTWSWFGLCCW